MPTTDTHEKGFPPIVSVEWLKEHLSDPDVLVVDTSIDMSRTGIPSLEVFMAEHVPGAIHFDIRKIAAPRTEPPFRMMPSPELFAQMVGALGISADHTLIFYDNDGLYTAARGWWMFHASGHARCAVLDGGLPAWKAAGGRVETGAGKIYSAASYPVPTRIPAVADWRDVLEATRTGSAQVVDVRPASMFNGDTSDRYPGVRPGHIPGSINMSQRELKLADKTFRSGDEMRAVISAHGIDLKKPIIVSCGGGITACILICASEIIGEGDIRLYDGSWEEWGRREDLPVAIDPGA